MKANRGYKLIAALVIWRQQGGSMDRPFLIGEKVYLRPIAKTDLQGYGRIINDRKVTRYLANSFYPKSDEYLENYIKGLKNDHYNMLFAVIDKESNKYIGNVKIGPINWISRHTKYGRMLSDEIWGKGYGTDLLRLVIIYVFEILNMRIMEGLGVTSNKGSFISNQKVGMKEVAVLKNYEFFNGEYHDMSLYLLTKQDYLDVKKQGYFDNVLKKNFIPF